MNLGVQKNVTAEIDLKPLKKVERNLKFWARNIKIWVSPQVVSAWLGSNYSRTIFKMTFKVEKSPFGVTAEIWTRRILIISNQHFSLVAEISYYPYYFMYYQKGKIIGWSRKCVGGVVENVGMGGSRKSNIFVCGGQEKFNILLFKGRGGEIKCFRMGVPKISKKTTPRFLMD